MRGYAAAGYPPLSPRERRRRRDANTETETEEEVEGVEGVEEFGAAVRHSEEGEGWTVVS